MITTKKRFLPKKIQSTRNIIEKLKITARRFLLPATYKAGEIEKRLFKKINKHDIVERLKILELYSPLGCEYKVNKIFPNTFLLSYKKTNLY